MHDWHWLQADNWKLISFSFKWAPQVYLTFQNKIFSAILLLSIMMVLNFALFLSSLRKLDQWIACIGMYGFWWSIIHFGKKKWKYFLDSLIFLNFYVLFFYVTVQYIKNIKISLQIKIVPKVQIKLSAKLSRIEKNVIVLTKSCEKHPLQILKSHYYFSDNEYTIWN